jgi:hypothetical protein
MIRTMNRENKCFNDTLIGIDGLINKLHTCTFSIIPIRIKVCRPENLMLHLTFSR